ncbi:RNI-like protein [Dichomitus squalens]|uniref:RNI-like protein n=1 Tax=Dichomitus squalens TaxID=114155 RepID=A0A4V6MVX4_9APHY|nr:RNI-like protein [Dichomitus squalens]
MSPPMSPYDPKYTWDRNPSRQAPLAVTVPPPDYPVETSHFSPESHRSSKPSRALHTRSRSDWTNTLTLKSFTNDPELGKTQPPQTPRTRDRLTKFLFDLRMPSRNARQEWLPMQEPPLQPWPPLEVEKHRHGFCDECQERNDRRRRNRAVLFALVILLLYLLGNVIFLNVRVVRLSQPLATSATSPAATTTASPSESTALSADAQSCLSQFALNAPSNPQSYPCSTCLPVLQNIPSNVTSASAQDAQQALSAVQFCGLRSIFETADSEGQTGLSNGGWVKDVRFCAWSGVQCDGFGRVSSIQLSFPGVPAKIPDEVTALTGLTSLQIVGDTNVPAGDIPASFGSLTALTNLHLESTAINTLPSAMLNSLNMLKTLVLVKNGNMTGDMSPGIASLALVNLVINNQPLSTDPISALLASSSTSSKLQTLGSLPSDLSVFTSLVELHLDNNSLTNPLPARFPDTLQALTLTNNSQLEGAVASGTSLCGLAQLKTCDVRGTGLSAQDGCGICQFS